jgi:hypothetical protein
LNPLLILTSGHAQDLEFTLPAKAIQYYLAGPKPALGFDAPNLKEFMKTPATLDSAPLKALMRTPATSAAASSRGKSKRKTPESFLLPKKPRTNKTKLSLKV